MNTDIDLMRHALGIQLRAGKWTEEYRNHFCASAGSDDDVRWLALVEAGLAEQISVPVETGELVTYRVTDAGKAMAKPAPLNTSLGCMDPTSSLDVFSSRRGS